jgi:hypothetical protein
VATCSFSNALAGTYAALTFFTDKDGDFSNSSSNTDTVSVGRPPPPAPARPLQLTRSARYPARTSSSRQLSDPRIGSGAPTGAVTLTDDVNPGTDRKSRYL